MLQLLLRIRGLMSAIYHVSLHPDSLWVWYCPGKGYWNAEEEKFVADKLDATAVARWRADLIITTGDEGWVPL